MTRRQLTGAQWREMPGEFGPWPTIYGRFRVWRNAGVFTVLLEVLIAEAARQGKTDFSLVSVGKDVMEALEEAAAEQEQARRKGVTRRNRTGRTEEMSLSVPTCDGATSRRLSRRRRTRPPTAGRRAAGAVVPSLSTLSFTVTATLSSG